MEIVVPHELILALDLQKNDLIRDVAEGILAECRDEPSSAATLAMYFAQRGELESAEIYADQLLARSEDVWVGLGHFALATAYQADSQREIAKLHSALAQTFLPESVEVKEQGAVIHMVSGEYELAKSLLDSVLSIEPGRGFARNARVYSSFRSGLANPTKTELDELLACEPEAWYSHYFRGRIEAERGHCDLARDFYLASLALEPERQWTLHALESLESKRSEGQLTNYS